MPFRVLRIAALLLFVSTGMAIGVARIASKLEGRQFGGPELVGVGKELVSRPAQEVTVFNAESGALHRVALPAGDSMDMVSVSPWSDRWGQRHVVGRWGRHDGTQSETLFHDFGLARLRFPTGELIDRIPLDVVPVTPPCWFPSTRARVLFVSGAGQLHTYSFEGQTGGDLPPDLERPLPVSWNVPGLSRCPGMIHDVTWPDRMGPSRYLLVSLTPWRQARGGQEAPQSELWWLRLDQAGRAITSAGPLISPARAEARLSLRRPSVGHDLDRGLRLACLSQETDSGHQDLLLFSFHFDPASGAPRLDPAPSCVISRNCAAVTPAFSSDGRWITYGRVGRNARLVLERAPLDLAACGYSPYHPTIGF